MSRRYQKVRVVRKGGFFGKFVSFFLGLILGIALLGGALFGAGYYVYKKPVGSTVKKVDGILGSDYYSLIFGTADELGYLDEKYINEKIATLLMDGGSAVMGLAGDGTLRDLCDVSPIVKKYVEDMLDSESITKYGIPLDTETLLDTPVKQLATYLEGQIKVTPLGNMLEGLGAKKNEILYAICYGEKEIDYIIDEEGKVVMLDPLGNPLPEAEADAKKTTFNDFLDEDGMDEIVGQMVLEVLMEIDPVSSEDATMRALAYGSSNRYHVVDKTVTENGVTKTKQVVEMLPVRYTVVENKVYDDKNEEVTGSYDPSTQILTVGEETQYLKADGDTYLAYRDENKTSAILYPKTKVKDLQDDATGLIDGITLKDALGIDDGSHKVLQALATGKDGVERTLADLKTKGASLIDDIALADVIYANTSDAVTMHILYGKKDVHYELNGADVVMLQKRILKNGDVWYNEYGEPLPDDAVNGSVYTENGVEYTVTPSSDTQDIKLKETDANGKDVIKTYHAQVYYVSLNGEAVSYEPTTIKDMGENSDVLSKLSGRLTIGELLDESQFTEDSLLKHVKDETINTLPTAIDNLTLQQVYPEQIYVNKVDDTEGMVGIWQYLLHDKDGEEIYTSFVDVDTLATNMQYNISNATLQDLHNHEVVQLSESTLTTEIFMNENKKPTLMGISMVKNVGTADEPQYEAYTLPEHITEKANPTMGEYPTIGEFTVEELTDYVDALMTTITYIQNGMQQS